MKQVIFDVMMQHVIFQSNILRTGRNPQKKKVLFSKNCITRFIKAIVFSENIGNQFFLFIENQHFYSKNVGFLFLTQSSNKNQYLRQ